MQVIRVAQIEEFAWELPRPVVAIGTLDGLHRGHQEILGRAARMAAELRGSAGVLTFAQHPLAVVRPEAVPPTITPLPLKLALLERLGMAAAVVLEFSPALAEIDAADFVTRVLRDRLGIAGLTVGYDFGFGRGRRGNATLLAELAPACGFRLEVVPAVEVDGQVVSSRVIRGLLAAGRVEEAQRLLGRPFCLLAEAEVGAGRGRGLGFPTANLPVPEPPVLGDGVYAGRVQVRGAVRDALMNLGRAPTFGPGARRLEVHIPGWEGALYGERLAVFVLARLREERRFPDPAALAAQLARDREAAERVWQGAVALPWAEWTLQV